MRFLRAHQAKGEVSLITIDIGANDIVNCVAAADPLVRVGSGAT